MKEKPSKYVLTFFHWKKNTSINIINPKFSIKFQKKNVIDITLIFF